MKIAGSSYPCPLCRFLLSKLDKYFQSLAPIELTERPSLQDLSVSLKGTAWKNIHIYNVFNLSTSMSEWKDQFHVLTPPLHTKLQVICKIVEFSTTF